jgi:hypothetical protein
VTHQLQRDLTRADALNFDVRAEAVVEGEREGGAL